VRSRGVEPAPAAAAGSPCYHCRVRGVAAAAVSLIALGGVASAGCHSSGAAHGGGGGPDAGADQRPPIPGTDVFMPGSDICGRSAIAGLPASQILDTGAVDAVRVLRFEGDRLFTGGADSPNPGDRWMLWSVSERTQLATGQLLHDTTNPGMPYPFADMRGGLLVTEGSPGSFELRSGDDGHVSATVDAPGSTGRGLASDGSYFWALTASGLSAWSPAGDALVTDASVDPMSTIAAVPGRLLLVNGYAADPRIQTIDVPGGASHLSDPITPGTSTGMPVQWLSDGAHLYAQNENTAIIYGSAGGTPVATRQGVYVDDGYGDYVWSFDLNNHLLDVMSLSRGLASVGTYNAAYVQYLGRGWLAMDVANPPNGAADPMAGAIAVLDLNKPKLTPEYIKYAQNLEDAGFNAPPAFSDDGRYVYLGAQGTVWTSDGANLGCGAIEAYAGADDGTLAVVTEVGILVFRPGGEGLTLAGRVNLTGQSLEMSGDGRLLAVRASWLYGARMVSVVSLETGQLLHTWGRPDAVGLGGPALPDPDFVVDFSLARNADRVATSFVTQTSFSGPWIQHVYLSDASGDNVQEVPGAGLNVRLSPDGSHLLAQSGQAGAAVSIFQGTTLLGTTVGQASSWWDDTHYVTRDYVRDASGAQVFADPTLWGVDGRSVVGVTLPSRVDDPYILVNYGHQPLVPLASGRVYASAAVAVLDGATGASLLPSVSGRIVVAVAGPFAVIARGDGARIEIQRL